VVIGSTNRGSTEFQMRLPWSTSAAAAV
jgi:hypothetical protein